MTVAEALRFGTEALNPSGADSAALEAKWLLRRSLGTSTTWMYLNGHSQLPSCAEQIFRNSLERRLNHEPLAYVLGESEFFGRSFAVDNRVLVPRPETEDLVDHVLAWAGLGRDGVAASGTIVDVGTGSGVLAVTLALELPLARVVAIDRSPDALAVAAQNCRRHRVEDRVCLIRSDLLSEVPEELAVNARVIVANLPYVRTNDLDDAQLELQWEPRVALDGGADGVEVYRRFFDQAPSVAGPGSALFVEIGESQGVAVERLAVSAFPAHCVTIRRDLSGRDRFVTVLPVETRSRGCTNSE